MTTNEYEESLEKSREIIRRLETENNQLKALVELLSFLGEITLEEDTDKDGYVSNNYHLKSRPVNEILDPKNEIDYFALRLLAPVLAEEDVFESIYEEKNPKTVS